MKPRRGRRSSRSDRGSLSIEFVLFTPMVFLVFALIYDFSRVSAANGLLDTGARDAARVASLAATATDAKLAATRVVEDEVGAGSQECRDSLDVQLTGPFAPGQTITVTASCRFSVSNLVGPSISVNPTSTFSSTIDPNRTIG